MCLRQLGLTSTLKFLVRPQRLVAPSVHGDLDYFGKTTLPFTTLVKLQSLPVIRDPVVLNRNEAGAKILQEPTRSREITLLGC
jgi:hypothetical protein